MPLDPFPHFILGANLPWVGYGTDIGGSAWYPSGSVNPRAAGLSCLRLQASSQWRAARRSFEPYRESGASVHAHRTWAHCRIFSDRRSSVCTNPRTNRSRSEAPGRSGLTWSGPSALISIKFTGTSGSVGGRSSSQWPSRSPRSPRDPRRVRRPQSVRRAGARHGEALRLFGSARVVGSWRRRCVGVSAGPRGVGE
jgi:hypothetical protein